MCPLSRRMLLEIQDLMNRKYLTVNFLFFFLGDEQGVQNLLLNLRFPNTAVNKQVYKIFLSFGQQKGCSTINTVIYIWSKYIWLFIFNQNIRSSKTWCFY